MRLLRVPLLVIVIALTACTNVEQSKDVYKSDSTGTELALQVCSACHGKTGQAVSDQFPKLAGQHKEYLLIQLSEFAEHRRSTPNAVAFMWSFNQLTPAQMNELAQYYSEQAPMIGEPSKSPLLARGKNIYEQGIPGSNVTACSSCHGSNATGGKEIPRLAGQHPRYLAEQINLFKSSTKRPNGVAMMSLTHSMSEEDIQAVSIYLGSLQVRSK
jgi:cytochrome c553